jgi:hypothetical protein
MHHSQEPSMSPLLVLITILIYAVAIVLLVRERSLRYLLMLAAGHITMLLTPIWQVLYGIEPVGGGLSLPGGFEVPWALLIGGGPLLALPPLLLYYGLRHGWWPRHYAAIWLSYAVFLIYFLLLEAILERSGTGLFSSAVIVEDTFVPAQLVQAILLAGVSLGMAYALVSTRHYALEVAFAPLVLSGMVSAALFLGILASPLWVSGLLDQRGLIVTSGALVSLLLVLWGVHLLASGLHAGRRQQFVWR